ncbi:unnamed protein product [Allacma fusca]|uniref:Orn/DAP/Arg decarboxylase 2 N-terminal domain-containing protein n=1 Tax=Allacma fusca TaxID=39272 RepID=A0A8J2PRQ2_9HEXA|nr:unnamed protein product [Allacma fusca]
MKTVFTNILEEKATEDAFYVCNLGEIIKKHQEWKTCMPRVKPFYAVKCNDDSKVLETLAGLGTGFDCASKAEISKVIQLGVHPSDIIFANPTKQASHVRAAADAGVRTMTFDNENELHKIKKLHPEARLVVRIRCDAEMAQCQLGMKFGVLVEDAPNLLAVSKELGLNVVGVSFHVGSGCMDPPVFHRAIGAASWLFNVAREFGYSFTLLDIGGGFPGNTGSSIVEIADIVNKSVDEYFPKGCGVEIIAEPGRYYVASAFTLVTQIHSKRDVKATSGETASSKSFMYYINDGVYGSFNCVLYDHAVVHPETLRDITSFDNLYECSVWGPTCDGLDQVCSNVMLPELDMGDWLVFNNMGAYTLVAAGTFNGFPVPRIQYIALKEAWATLREFMDEDKFVADNVPIFMKAGVGCNRDAVGWGLNDVFEHIKNRNLPNDFNEDAVDDFGFCFEGFFYEYSTDIPAQ